MKQVKPKYRINRFPVFMVVNYVSALKKGYDEKTAKALAYATALFIAIVRNKGYVSNKPKVKTTTRIIKHKAMTEDASKIKFFNYKFDVKVGNDGQLHPIIAGKEITAEDFDRELYGKLGKEADKFVEYAKQYIQKFKEIKDPYKIYQGVRDVWRTSEFFEALKELYK